jgi:hypothetical protein
MENDPKEKPPEPVTNPDPFEWAPDICQYCGEQIGIGIRALHLGICDKCSEKANGKVH